LKAGVTSVTFLVACFRLDKVYKEGEKDEKEAERFFFLAGSFDPRDFLSPQLHPVEPSSRVSASVPLLEKTLSVHVSRMNWLILFRPGEAQTHLSLSLSVAG
jgi:hypothetical protein